MANSGKSITFLFETNGATFVDVLADSAVWPGIFASQNAGSSNPSIYYQVGGSGVNGQFFDAIASSGELDSVNQRLIDAYDRQFGVGAYQQDSARQRRDRLTSLWIPLPSGKGKIGTKVAGMIYSVGPVLGVDGITDRLGYAKIYEDAILAIQRAEPAIECLRIVMLSCGVYARNVKDKARLFIDAAECILDGIQTGVHRTSPECSPTILINHRIGPDGASTERDAFLAAAASRGISKLDQNGFLVPI